MSTGKARSKSLTGRDVNAGRAVLQMTPSSRTRASDELHGRPKRSRIIRGDLVSDSENLEPSLDGCDRG